VGDGAGEDKVGRGGGGRDARAEGRTDGDDALLAVRAAPMLYLDDDDPYHQ